MNSVSYILENRPLTKENKLAIKALGRCVPHLDIRKATPGKTRQFNRYFKAENTYNMFSWMCGCPIKNKLFCFVCILISDTVQSSPWTHEGYDDLGHLRQRAKNHENTGNHIDNLLDFNVLGKVDIRKQLNNAYLEGIRKHNENVDKNRHMLRRLIMCIKFCGAFELALRPENEREQSQNSEVFRGLINFTSELDSVLATHLKESTIFEGNSKTIQNELLDAILKVCRDEISYQITAANFLAIEADEMTDSFNEQQLVVIFRYVFQGNIYERFWGFFRPVGYCTPESKADVIKRQLDYLNIPKEKLVAQSSDGCSVTKGKIEGVQSLIKKTYPNAHYVHCYTHRFNLILEKASACHKKLKIFFAEIQAFVAFFSRSTKRCAVLDEIAMDKFPRQDRTRWNSHTRIINIIHEAKELIQEYLEALLDAEKDSKTIHEASALLKNLALEDFNYFLKVTHWITPHVEALFKKVCHDADGARIHKCLSNFEFQIAEIRDKKINEFELGDGDEPTEKRKKLDDINQDVAKEYCDVIMRQIRERLDFTGHLSAARLFPSNFPMYKHNFPEEHFNDGVKAYESLIDKEKLRTELKVIYNRSEMSCDGVLPLLTFISKNNLEQGLSEIYKILDIICTTPMITNEQGRCFSTLNRIKCFLRNTMGQERLNALGMLSVEKELVQSIPDFDNKIINMFVGNERREMDFLYK